MTTHAHVSLWDKLPCDIQNKILDITYTFLKKEIVQDIPKRVRFYPGKQIFIKRPWTSPDASGISLDFYFDEHGHFDSYLKEDGWHDRFESEAKRQLYIRTYFGI